MTLLPMRARLRPRPDTFEHWHMVEGRNVCTRYTWIEPFPRLPKDARKALNPLMRFAASVWATFTLVWGGPRAMLRARALSVRDWRLARDMLFHLEQLVRRVLLVAALALNLPPRPPATADRVRDASRRMAPRRRHENSNSPRTWRVSFRALPATFGASQASVRRIRQRQTRPRVALPTRGLARRMEALVRAMTHGRAHARRLAHTLARIAGRNAHANAPRLLGLPYYDYHPLARTTGKHLVHTGMQKAALLSVRELTRWNAQWIRLEPG